MACPNTAWVKRDEGLVMRVSLDNMKKGGKGKVAEVVGGRGVMLKLSAQGIVPGKSVEKVGHLRGGPVLLRVGRCDVAIGLGLARKVYVEVVDA
jgi:ferrous iron transport protein A